MLCNAMGLGVYGSTQISVTKEHGPSLLASGGGGWVSDLQKKTLRDT